MPSGQAKGGRLTPELKFNKEIDSTNLKFNL